MKFNHWLPKLITKIRNVLDDSYKLNAIVLLGIIYFYDKEKDVDERLFKHELKHVEQQKEDGICFYFIYLKDWFVNIFKYIKFKDLCSFKRLFNLFDKAYLDIPYEKEAREAERK